MVAVGVGVRSEGGSGVGVSVRYGEGTVREGKGREGNVY